MISTPRNLWNLLKRHSKIEVVALDWRWLFIYPNARVATINYLVIPADVPVHFRLTSTSVMNSFFIPQLGSQIYTMPGMTTQLNLQADKAGTYDGLSAQFSGDGFSDMHFGFVVESEEDFRHGSSAPAGRARCTVTRTSQTCCGRTRGAGAA